MATDSLSLWGVYAFLLGLSVGLSGVRTARVEIIGLFVQPYLLLALPVLPYLIVTRAQRIPLRAASLLAVFCFIFVLAGLGTPNFVKDATKLITSVAAIAAAAMMIDRRSDFIAGAVGMALALAATGIRGLGVDAPGAEVTVEALGGLGNKNAYSIYALPVLLFAGFVVLRFKAGIWLNLAKVIMIASSLIIVATIFSSGNRSGYAGCAIIGVVLFWNRKLTGLIFVSLLTVGVSAWLIHTNGFQQLYDKWNDSFASPETTNVARSDDIRRTLIMNCVKLGLENPILGVSPYQAGFEIVRGTKVEEVGAADPHNVFAQVVAGCGFICLFAMIGFGIAISRWSGPDRPLLLSTADGRAMLWLLRWLAISWAFRGMFATDVLYGPSFCLAFGWAMGLASTEARRLRERMSASRGARPAAPLLSPLAVR